MGLCQLTAIAAAAPEIQEQIFYLGHHNQLNWKVILRTESLFFREHFPVLKTYMNFWSLENVCALFPDWK